MIPGVRTYRERRRATVAKGSQLKQWPFQRTILSYFRIDVHVLTDIEYEIEPAVEVIASVRYPHQQFGLE